MVIKQNIIIKLDIDNMLEKNNKAVYEDFCFSRASFFLFSSPFATAVEAF